MSAVDGAADASTSTGERNWSHARSIAENGNGAERAAEADKLRLRMSCEAFGKRKDCTDMMERMMLSAISRFPEDPLEYMTTYLEREVETARARAEDAERRVSLMGQELDVLKEQLDRAKLETREERRKLEEASAASRRAEDDVKELTEQLAAERQKNSTRQREDATAQSRAKERNQEVARYQKENRLLAEENEKLNAKIDTLTKARDAAKARLQSLGGS